MDAGAQKAPERNYSHNVGMGETLIARVPGILSSLGIGSCLAVALFDERAGIAGMVHIMLPREFKSPMGDLPVKPVMPKPGKFADMALRNLVDLLQKEGAAKSRLKAKFAGGAKMFSISRGPNLLSIGEQNIAVVLEELQSLKIPLEGQDTGGTRGRSITFFTETWEMEVRAIGQTPFRI
ncbi:MAG TPA: chemotaxis protein CheD [Synergistetes bacterium]|nr:chemotaxis protein CheD [Synergistota bacterium]